ncbi:oxidative stress survival, Svf1-like protein [Dendrothele bispora CBS 962.96]|uniref:Oxidative stress survival, Svf1-like protein n=1 Tax=Dendrothele bispora (strain CBS 962.96) TaxID=1314807 RepID=A0A4S8MKD4_DENBC|nr:oxidative stress survival, Svf1-like protein [Dendrothele bispora CBS 962.96]
MFSSLFSTSPPVDPTAPNFHPVSSKYKDAELFGELTPQDTEMLCTSSGFVTETLVFYVTTPDGMSVMCQVIHSAVGVWYPTIQFTCKIYDPQTKKSIWKSVNVSNFACPIPGRDKRSCKADQFSITHKSSPGSDYPESYVIQAQPSDDVQIFLEVLRPANVPGYKIGNDAQGGYSYFGPDPKNAEGYVIHRFWPQNKSTGHLTVSGQAKPVEGLGMFVHAIQGMRPNLVAASWNFNNFQSSEHGGVSAVQMEFITTEAYGKKGTGSGGVAVNIGSLVVGGKLVCITAETKWPGEALPADAPIKSRVSHLKPLLDAETGYQKPSEFLFEWAGPSIIRDAPGSYKASLQVDVGDVEHPKGLIEKVDVLAEIPYVIKMAVNYVAGTKPYIYQWSNPAKLSITEPNGNVVEANGHAYNEATFIS